MTACDTKRYSRVICYTSKSVAASGPRSLDRLDLDTDGWFTNGWTMGHTDLL